MYEDLVKQARAYAERDEYVVTRNLLMRLCDALETQEDIKATLWLKMLDDKQNFLDAERYRWLRDGAWDVPRRRLLLLLFSVMVRWRLIYGLLVIM